jgi:VanZ family protein
MLTRFSVRWLVLLPCGTAVIALTTLPPSVRLIYIVGHLSHLSGHPNVSDAVGHAALHGTLTLIIYWTLHRRIGFARALWIALLVAMSLGLSTELIQHFTPGRSMQLSDLLGNWLGAMTVALLISFRHASSDAPSVDQRLQDAP